MLVELGLVEQRHRAVMEVLDGSSVIDVAGRYGVSRQSVHAWLRRYANQGLAGLADRSSRPDVCPHQMAAEMRSRWWRCAWPTRGGGRERSGPVWPGRA
jgi:transposase-like protein